VLVVLDKLAPGQGAFAYALEWASRLGLSLGGIRVPGEGPGAADGLAAACAGRGVCWEGVHREAAPATLAGKAAPLDLLVLGPGVPAGERKRWLRGGFAGAAVHVCPARWQPWTRALLLDEEGAAAGSFLAGALALCRRLRLKAVVLTVARSERHGRLRQENLQKALAAGPETDCDWDLLIGEEIRRAVSHVARWRRCQLVMAERPAAPPWWRWWHGGFAEKLVGLAGELSCLALPGTAAHGALEAPGLSRTESAPRGGTLCRPAVPLPGPGNAG
jgi:hypothetical protein